MACKTVWGCFTKLFAISYSAAKFGLSLCFFLKIVSCQVRYTVAYEQADEALHVSGFQVNIFPI